MCLERIGQNIADLESDNRTCDMLFPPRCPRLRRSARAGPPAPVRCRYQSEAGTVDVICPLPVKERRELASQSNLI